MGHFARECPTKGKGKGKGKAKGDSKGGTKGGGKGKASNLDGRGAKEFTGKKAKNPSAVPKPPASVKKDDKFDKKITTEAIVPVSTKSRKGTGRGKGATSSSALVPVGTTLATR